MPRPGGGCRFQRMRQHSRLRRSDTELGECSRNVPSRLHRDVTSRRADRSTEHVCASYADLPTYFRGQRVHLSTTTHDQVANGFTTGLPRRTLSTAFYLHSRDFWGYTLYDPQIGLVRSRQSAVLVMYIVDAPKLHLKVIEFSFLLV